MSVCGQALGVSSPPEPLARGPPLQTLTILSSTSTILSTTLEGSPAVPCTVLTVGGHRTLLCVRSRKDPAVILTQVGFTPPRAAGDDAYCSYISSMRMRGAMQVSSCRLLHRSEEHTVAAFSLRKRGHAAEKALICQASATSAQVKAGNWKPLQTRLNMFFCKYRSSCQ